MSGTLAATSSASLSEDVKSPELAWPKRTEHPATPTRPRPMKLASVESVARLSPPGLDKERVPPGMVKEKL